MSDSNDTSALDEKNEEQNESQDDNYASNAVSFFITTLQLCVIILIYFAFGGLLLYGTKLGQTNILPTNQNCSPYTDNKPTIPEKTTSIFTNAFINPTYSMKMKFPHDEYNFSNKLLDMFSDYKKEPESNFLANYFISILEGLLCFNYSILNFILNGMNQLPEAITILFGVIVFSFIFFGLVILNNFYAMYLWFANMKWFFKKNNNNDTGEPKWEDVKFASLDNACAFGLVFLFFIAFFISIGFFPILSIMLLIYCLCSVFSYKFLLNDKSSSIFVIIQNVFKYYKVTIMTIFSILVVTSAFANMGTMPGVFSLVTLGLVYFGMLGITIFKPIDMENLTPIGDFDQAIKKCIKKQQPKKDGSSMFNFNFFGGGKDLTNQLKKLNKNFT